MNAAPHRARVGTDADRWPSGSKRWDRRISLSDTEIAALAALGPQQLRRNKAVGIPRRTAVHWRALTRLVEPLDATVAELHHDGDVRFRRAGRQAVAIVLARCAETGRSWWGWTPWEWAALCGGSAREFATAQPLPTESTVRPFLVALAYLLGGFTGFHRLGMFNRLHLACLIFGKPAVAEAMGDAEQVLDRWGYRISGGARTRMHGVFSQALLLNHSPGLADLSTSAFDALRAHPATDGHQGSMLYALQRAVAELGHCDPPVRTGYNHSPGIVGTVPGWADWIERWHATSTLTPHVRRIIRSIMAKAGRWLAVEHPEITEPGQWTRAICAQWVAAVDRMTVGDWVQRRDMLGSRTGEPVSPRTKAHNLMATRTFFRDCQEWEWIPRRFDPNRALTLPRSVAALIGTNPRVIADDVWAKLLWAGLNLEPADLPGNSADTFYPMELIRAVTVTWLFSGLRSDEITRLRVGCIRWQHDGAPIPGDSRDILAEDAICLLDVPVHKTGTAFTKPVDPLVGQAIQAWQTLRPDQPKRLDRKTSERVDMLFAVRAQPVAKAYINHTIIPALCGKAGVPTTDVRGTITSHRARSTIASQLYNAKEPMTLFELQAWLGHRTPNTTQHYAKITPNTLSKAYSEAGYFARNVRTIEVLVDRDAVTSGAAANGQPWQYYDLGHGWCTYSFFEQCPHRMACARCDFYTPKASSKAQILEAKDNLQRMLSSIPLTDDERAAVDDGQSALDRLLERLADVTTPTGQTPREIGIPPTATLLPITPL
ncbi:tyrosine-type recombinase/integrase [Nocardia sp. NBC_01730]|uniref:tyrosine-type recombinase/integrase n=1 Tax=Nocardia sp. NBC_01730 TaxID=2975998 RepID=UPI002E13C0B1|nr:tyrosine-type recombinase/integrase [Nocardia sp. NBC_01730]WSG61012.1 tyrosine-type recombinase/integrase [Nocardia sp. NBC_01730]